MLGRATTAVVITAVLTFAPAGTASAFAPAGADPVCTVTDGRLAELSGLATTSDGYLTINDKTTKADRNQIFFLDRSCQVVHGMAYPRPPVDTEDLAVDRDGTVWVGDIGDNESTRAGIGLWQLSPGATEPVYRELRYPDRPHNAETLLLDGDGTPIVVTKDPAGARIYTGREGTLRDAGTVTLPATTTSNPRGAEGRTVLTGGATSRDGAKVVVRTYADAFEYPVADGDVIAALTSGTPRVTALPDEPQGESVTYSQDGSFLLTVSEADGTKEKPTILRYESKLAGAPAGEAGGSRTWMAVVAGAAVLLLVALAAGARRVTSRT